MPSPIYFIRHGESTANETNVIAGLIDSDLTELGEHQAREAGRRLLSRQLSFDAVHTSGLRRAWRTAEIALQTANLDDTPILQDRRLAERDFGVLNGWNKHLVRKVYGYQAYEHYMNSPFGELAEAETFRQMYTRVADYYAQVLHPATQKGQRILVVAHKYIIELFALVIAKIPPENYFDIRLPNSTPMSETELAHYARSSRRAQKELADRTVYHTSHGVALAALAGVAARLFSGLTLDHLPFLVISALLLAAISFFVMIGINSRHVVAGLDPRGTLNWSWILRMAVATALFLATRDSWWGILFLLGLMPPALSSPALSLLWGGEQYTAVRSTVLLTLLGAGATALLVGVSGVGAIASVIAFLLLFVLAFLLPSATAQIWRMRRPIAAGAFGLHWRWLGNIALFLMAFVSMVRFTPPELSTLATAADFLLLLQGGAVIGLLLALRLWGWWSGSRLTQTSAQHVDHYIVHATPAIFLWMVFVSARPELLFLGFWGCLAFFLLILVDEQIMTHRQRGRPISLKGDRPSLSSRQTEWNPVG